MLLAISLVPDLVGQMLGHQRLVLGGEWGLLGEVDELEVGRVAGIGGRCGRHLLNPCIEGGVASLGHASRQGICQHEDEFKRSTSREGESETNFGVRFELILCRNWFETQFELIFCRTGSTQVCRMRGPFW